MKQDFRRSFALVWGWMKTDLELYGRELDVYALIYSYSANGNGTFHATREFIAQWSDISINHVSKVMKSLVDKGYIIKEENPMKQMRVRIPHVYRANPEFVPRLEPPALRTV